MTFNDERSAAIREGLVATVRRPRLQPAMRGRLTGIALLASGLLIGGAVSAAAVTISRPPVVISGTDTPAPPVVISGTDSPAPPGVLPGEPIVSLLGELTTVAVEGTQTITLPAVPTGATHVRVSVACVTAGTISWGFDPSGNNPSSGCSASDVRVKQGATDSAGWMDFELVDGNDTFYIGANDAVAGIVSFQFLNYIETDLGVNARGETFGVVRDGKPVPELQSAWGTDDSGAAVLGYVRATDFEAFGPDWPGQPSNPTEALVWQQERDAKYPNGWDIPVFDSDGITEIGRFHIG